MIELTALDRLEIIELQSIYAWGIDMKDGSLFARAFTDDVEAEYPLFGRLKGLDFFTKWQTDFNAVFEATQHLISNHRLEVDGDEVVYRSYVIATMFCPGTPGGDQLTGGGHYVDRVVRTDAGWRIRSRDVVNFWRTGNMALFDVGSRAVAHLWEGVNS
jgi:hypothetical protein